MPYNSKACVLEMIIWNYNCLLRTNIIIYLKPYNCVQVNDFY